MKHRWWLYIVATIIPAKAACEAYFGQGGQDNQGSKDKAACEGGQDNQGSKDKAACEGGRGDQDSKDSQIGENAGQNGALNIQHGGSGQQQPQASPQLQQPQPQASTRGLQQNQLQQQQQPQGSAHGQSQPQAGVQLLQQQQQQQQHQPSHQDLSASLFGPKADKIGGTGEGKDGGQQEGGFRPLRGSDATLAVVGGISGFASGGGV